MADDVQSPEGDQGAEATDSGYTQYLDSVAPEIRDQVEPIIKEFDGNVTKKFQEHADYRKGWAPYEELGLKDIPPENLQELLAFAQMANNPQQFDEWLKSTATERGLLNQPDDLDLDLEDDENQVEERLLQKVTEMINPLMERFEHQEQAKLVESAETEISGALDSILGDDKNQNLPEGARDAIEALAYRYTDEPGLSGKEVIEKGFADYQNLIGQGEKGLFAQKEKQPETPEGPGAASTADEKITSFGDPRLLAMAKERMKQSA